MKAYLGTACAKFLEVQAYAEDGCGNATYSPKVAGHRQQHRPLRARPTRAPLPARPRRPRTLVSELGVPGGAGQVVANGEAAFPRAGRSPLAIRLKRGENRVEATLVEARSGGTWRFELGGRAGLPARRPLRVVAGEVVQLAADSVTFRLQGRPGERVVFAFRAEPSARRPRPRSTRRPSSSRSISRDDRVRGGRGVRGLGDRAAHDEVVGARGERRRRRRRPGLVAEGRARRPDAGRHDQEVAPAGLADERHLVRGGHDAVRPRLLRELARGGARTRPSSRSRRSRRASPRRGS